MQDHTGPRCEDLLRSANLVDVLFPEAAARWLETRKPYLADRTIQDYEQYIGTLSAFFGELKLTEIGADDLRAYQRARMATTGASRINQECSIVQQMLKRIGRWADLAAHYEPLPKPKKWESPGRALSDVDRDHLFRMASSNPRWEMAYLFALISVNTSAGPKEVWTLRRRDVNLSEEAGELPARAIRIQPEGAKNRKGRVRIIPLNDVAFAAFERVLELATKRGSYVPDHFVFPFRVKGNSLAGTYDPERHCTTCKTAWKELTVAADLPGLRPYDMRHTCITDLLSDPEVSEETATAIAGHISKEMLKTYSHIRVEEKRKALNAVMERYLRNPLKAG